MSSKLLWQARYLGAMHTPLLRSDRRRCTIFGLMILLLSGLSTTTVAQGSAGWANGTRADTAIAQMDWSALVGVYRPIPTAMSVDGLAWLRLAAGRHSLGAYPESGTAYGRALALNMQPVACGLMICTDGPPSAAQSPDSVQSPRCRDEPALQVLSFWVGAWRVVDASGVEVGSNRVESILDSCALLEHWTGADGSTGLSLFYFVSSMRQWKQVWVTPSALAPGGLKEKHLVALSPARAVRFQGDIVGPRGTIIFDRTTLSPLKDGRVHQSIEISRDGGTTWTATFDAFYVRDVTVP